MNRPNERRSDAFKRIGKCAPHRRRRWASSACGWSQAGYRGDEALPCSSASAWVRVLRVPGVGDADLRRRTSCSRSAAAALGYLLPGMVLARMAKKRQHRIRLSLADALDLLVVSVEAGLGLDQALAARRRGARVRAQGSVDELRLVNLELRAGKARSDALRNLADRTGVDDLCRSSPC